MKKLLMWLACFLLCVNVCSFIGYAVEDEVDAEIKVVGNKREYSYTFDTKVEVLFHDIDLYHENLFLSYHVYDVNGALVEYENQRIPINMETDSFSCPLNIDLSVLSDGSNTEKYVVKFDIIDVQNAYWYSDADLYLKTDMIYVEQDALKAFCSGILGPIQQHPYVFFVNFICLLAFVIVAIKYRKIFE